MQFPSDQTLVHLIYYRHYNSTIYRIPVSSVTNKTPRNITSNTHGTQYQLHPSVRKALILDPKDIEVLGISFPQLEISKGFREGDGAARKAEGRKWHATVPCCRLGISRSKNDNKTEEPRWGEDRVLEERNANRHGEAGKRRAAWTAPLQRLASLQKQTPHLLWCSSLPQLPAVITRLCLCQHAPVRERTCDHAHSRAIRACRQAERF